MEWKEKRQQVSLAGEAILEAGESPGESPPSSDLPPDVASEGNPEKGLQKTQEIDNIEYWLECWARTQETWVQIPP